ncbi:MAG: PBP1A family penicillin-binding protein [Rhizobiales bacterium]|nr:PBP1A family penicillin-binding protein [Hyphomicrobiales bacterium]
MDFQRVTRAEKLQRRIRDWDARVEHSLFQLGRRLGEILWRIRHASEKLEPSPFGRVVVTICCEALTYIAIGGVLLTALAKPAMRAVNEENWLKQTDLAITFLDQSGGVLGKRGILHLESVAVEQLPEHLVKAVLGTEDRRFYEHFGIDIGGLIRAMMTNARAGGVVQGGSTITQQLAKNLFLSNERSLERKIKEAFLAFWLEARLPKNEILKLYLDRAYLGNGVFGVQSAAEHYFGKNVRDISLAEAAMIAGLFKAPSRFSPMVNLPAARARASDVLSNMVEAKFLTQGQVAAALRNPATPVERNTDTVADYALDYGFEEIKQLALAGKLGNERTLVVRTPIDRALQRHAERVTNSILQEFGPGYGVNQSATVVLDLDGGLKAMVGGRDYGLSQFNRATQAMRPPGSSFKSFVYGAALAEGIVKPDTIVTDKPTCVGNWCPNNYGRSYAGSMTATVAFAKSINTIPVQLTTALGKGNAKIGRQKVVDFTKAIGFTNTLRDMTSMPIGSSEVTVIDMAAGTNTFANGGKLAKPYVAREILNPQGEVIYRIEAAEARHTQVMSETAARELVFMMSKVPTEGTGRRAALPGIPTGGKTGTTDEYRNAWYMGFSGNFTAVVWFGNDDFSPTNRMTGGSLPGMTFARIMAFAHLDADLKPLYGLENEKPVRDPKLAELAGASDPAGAQSQRMLRLTPRGKALLKEIEALADDPSESPLSLIPTAPGRS